LLRAPKGPRIRLRAGMFLAVNGFDHRFGRRPFLQGIIPLQSQVS
jgi:hypothetical protein